MHLLETQNREGENLKDSRYKVSERRRLVWTGHQRGMSSGRDNYNKSYEGAHVLPPNRVGGDLKGWT